MSSSHSKQSYAIRFRELLLLARNVSSPASNSSAIDYENDTSSESLKRLMEEIEYNRATAEIGASFAMGFTVLGTITIFINIIILAILCANSRLVLQQVFYLLIINFAIIDTLKGVCLASHALRFIVPPSVYEDRKVLGTKIDQYVFIFFRLFNLATIFNLLMITLNEFVYIKFPLRYHQLVRRRTVLLLVLLSWIISASFTVASSLAKGKEETVYISTNSSFRNRNESYSQRGVVSYRNKNVNVRRSDFTADMDLHTIFMFALTGFCLFSLLVVLICYIIFFLVIRSIQKHDSRLHIDANRRMSEASINVADLQNLDERKIKRQLMKRYKYVLVIGSVILVYMLYLISYSSIQILQYFNLNRRNPVSYEKMRNMLISRWILVLLCGLHSTIQPTCYFRMREFREIVMRVFLYPCKKDRRRNDRSDFVSSIADNQSTNYHKVTEGDNGNGPSPEDKRSRRHSRSSPSAQENLFRNGNGFYGSPGQAKHAVIRFQDRRSPVNDMPETRV